MIVKQMLRLSCERFQSRWWALYRWGLKEDVPIITYMERESLWIFSSCCLATPLMHSCICRPVRCDVGICLDNLPTSSYVKPHINYHTGYQPKYKEVHAALRHWWMSVFYNCHSLKMVSVCNREDTTEIMPYSYLELYPSFTQLDLIMPKAEHFLML